MQRTLSSIDLYLRRSFIAFMRFSTWLGYRYLHVASSPCPIPSSSFYTTSSWGPISSFLISMHKLLHPRAYVVHLPLFSAYNIESLEWGIGTRLLHVHVPLLVLKSRHLLSGSSFCWVDIGLPEQAVGGFPPRFGIGCGRWTYWAFVYINLLKLCPK